MKKRNLNAKKITLNFYKDNLKKAQVNKLYKKLKKNLNALKFEKICLMVSGGPDSLALLFLLKCYSIEKRIELFCFLVDHKIRKESSFEANQVKNFLKKYHINCKILKSEKMIKSSNLQSNARILRYNLVFEECKKQKIKYVFTGHHHDDLYENFFIRLIRGSGLKGLISFNKIITKIETNNNITIVRPLLNFTKKQLLTIVNETFTKYINDPSNYNQTFLRSKIRNLIEFMKKEGFDSKKFDETLSNLTSSNCTIDFYTDKNLKDNVKYYKNFVLVNNSFFHHPFEVVFRALGNLLISFSKNKNYVRGKKLKDLINWVKLRSNSKKMTLSGCIFEKTSNTLIISREK